MDNGRMAIGLVLTGGTIGSSDDHGVVALRSDGMLVVDVSDRGLGDEAHLVARAWPGPERLELRVRTPLRKLSESMTPVDWVLIANSVRELVEIEGATSVVIFHGTDTACFTAAALSFLLNDVDVPVVITGANLPSSDVNSDALVNTRDALIAARTLPPGVYLSFAGAPELASHVHLGTTVRKIAAAGQPFSSPNRGPIAIVQNQILDMTRKAPVRQHFTSKDGISDAAALVNVYPGVDLKMTADALIESGKRGVVVCMYSGITGPESLGTDSLPTFVRRCTSQDIVVVTAVDYFAELTFAYPSFSAAISAGALFAADIIPETAYVKLAWALGQTEDADEARRIFALNVAGESAVDEINLDELPTSEVPTA